MFKFSDIENQEEWTWNNIYQHEKFTNFERLIIGCKDKEIPLILQLCKSMKGPFGILHVLLVSRLGNGAARYQSPEPIAYDDLELFLYEHQEYFEQDGRHHLWVSSVTNEGQFIFDKHNLIYAYGDIEGFKNVLSERRFSEGKIEIPAPHTHNYHHQFDEEEDSVLSQWDWIKYPLQESDED